MIYNNRKVFIIGWVVGLEFDNGLLNNNFGLKFLSDVIGYTNEISVSMLNDTWLIIHQY